MKAPSPGVSGVGATCLLLIVSAPGLGCAREESHHHDIAPPCLQCEGLDEPSGRLEYTGEVGERVFIVGNPSFLFFNDGDEASWFSELYPLVSSGRVLALDGRGMVISNLAYPGNSGGPVLDAQGRIVGVAY